MFDVVINDETEDREILHHLLKRVNIIMADLSKLQSAADRLTKAVEALIVAVNDPAVQVAVDSVADALDAEAVKAEAAVAPPVPPPVPVV